MSTSLEAMAQASVARAKATKQKKHTYKLLVAAWLVLIGGGITAAKLYTDHLKQQIATQISKQTDQQLQQVQADYTKQLSDLKASVDSNMGDLQKKVDNLNQLLAFTKDSANSKTDNSNQLYSQLADVKKKLDELQKNLDALK